MNLSFSTSKAGEAGANKFNSRFSFVLALVLVIFNLIIPADLMLSRRCVSHWAIISVVTGFEAASSMVTELSPSDRSQVAEDGR
jgi:hypothetical protein